MSKLNVLNLVLALNGKKGGKNKKGKMPGSNRNTQYIPAYNSLKVVPRSKRTEENCNSHGVNTGNQNA